MSELDIVRGITPVDPEQHIAVADYRRQAIENEVHVIEMANGIAKHLGGRIAVFGRWITTVELQRRQTAYDCNPIQFLSDHIKSLSK